MTLDDIVNISKRRGFITQSSEVYGGFSSSYDYGPLGAELKKHIKDAWWRSMIYGSHSIVGLDSAILMNPKVWEASGHLGAGFTDPLVECKKCHHRFRADNLKKEACPNCGGELTKEQRFNLMMKTFVGPVEDTANEAYLRPETAQGIYVNFPWVKNSRRLKIPFGIAQIGKAFRNEITPGNFTYRMREFEQMEMQFFVRPENAHNWFETWKKERIDWYVSLGIKRENLRFHDHAKDELAHYAKAAVDIEYRFPEPLGWRELEGIHNRGDWDLSRHKEFSGKKFDYLDDSTGDRFIPYIIETSSGADRAALVFLCEAYSAIEGGRSEKATKNEEIVLRFNSQIAPVKAAVFPLVKNKPELVSFAQKICDELRKAVGGVVIYDESGSIGRRYRRQDEIGTPFCITVDFDSIEKNSVTVRNRDTMEQERISVDNLLRHIQKNLSE